MSEQTIRWRRSFTGFVTVLVAAVLLLPATSAGAQQQPALPGDPARCSDGTSRNWSRFAGGPYPGRFSGPSGIVLDEKGDLWIADSRNSRLQHFTTDGQLLGIIDLPADGAVATPTPTQLGIDPSGRLYVLDSASQRVLKVSPDGTVLATLLPDPVETRTTELFGRTVTETDVKIRIGAIAVGKRYLYMYAVATSKNEYNLFPIQPQLKRFDLETGASALLSTEVLKPITPGRPIAYPAGMAVDADGFLYVTESSQYGGAIHKLTADGDAVAHWTGARSDDERRMYQLGWITVGADGNIYVSADGGWAIRAFTRDGAFLGVWQASYAGGIAVDRAGVIYTTGGSRDGKGQIAKLAPTGETFAWIGAPADAPGLLESLAGVEIDAAGDVLAMTGRTEGAVVVQRFAPSGRFVGTSALKTPVVGRNAVRSMRLAPDGSAYALTPQYGNDGERGVLKFSADGQIVKRWTSTTRLGERPNDVKAYVVAPDEAVYVATEDSVFKFSPDGQQLARWRAEDVDRWAPRGRTFTATALALDREGNVYVGGRWYLYKLTPDGTVLARWGTVPPDERIGGESLFAGVNSLAVDDAGNIIVSHGGPEPLTMLAPDGTVLAAWGKQQHPGDPPIGEDPPGGALRLGKHGEVYVWSGREIWRFGCGATP